MRWWRCGRDNGNNGSRDTEYDGCGDDDDDGGSGGVNSSGDDDDGGGSGGVNSSGDDCGNVIRGGDVCAVDYHLDIDGHDGDEINEIMMTDA